MLRQTPLQNPLLHYYRHLVSIARVWVWKRVCRLTRHDFASVQESSFPDFYYSTTIWLEMSGKNRSELLKESRNRNVLRAIIVNVDFLRRSFRWKLSQPASCCCHPVCVHCLNSSISLKLSQSKDKLALFSFKNMSFNSVAFAREKAKLYLFQPTQ